jgi:uncharacterized metal-binding protein
VSHQTWDWQLPVRDLMVFYQQYRLPIWSVLAGYWAGIALHVVLDALGTLVHRLLGAVSSVKKPRRKKRA